MIAPATGPTFSPAFVASMFGADWAPSFDPWRHGGYYVTNLRYPTGAVGCVAKVGARDQWSIACPDGWGAHVARFSNRRDAAQAERIHVLDQWAACLDGMARSFLR